MRPNEPDEYEVPPPETPENLVIFGEGSVAEFVGEKKDNKRNTRIFLMRPTDELRFDHQIPLKCICALPVPR